MIIPDKFRGYTALDVCVNQTFMNKRGKYLHKLCVYYVFYNSKRVIFYQKPKRQKYVSGLGAGRQWFHSKSLQ